MSISASLETPKTSGAMIGDLTGRYGLEGDLIASNVPIEGWLLTLRESPFAALRWLFRGAESLGTIPFDPASLIYDTQRLEDLRARQARGDTISITSNLPSSWQAAIMAHLGLGGQEPAQNASPILSPSPFSLSSILKLLRPHQWLKNILIFVPLILSHKFLIAEPLINAIIAFVCFSLVASSIYILNDMMDLRQDRRHPSKRRRPFASGAVPVSWGLSVMPLLLVMAAGLTFLLPKTFALVLLAYVALNIAYTFYLKRKLLVDVMALTGAYTLRILAGNAAGPIEISNWLLAFTMFFFLSLALIKRYVELDTVSAEPANAKRVMGRGYRKDDLDMISQLGVASGFASIVVLALYVEGAGKSGLYAHREVIWLIVPIMLYIIGRIWVLAKRRELPDDPVMFLIRDWRTHLMAIIMACVFFLAV